MSVNFKQLFNLQNGEEDKATTLENVKNNISFKGANLWILACAIMIASVGLNVNSTAVIIGAMLISPLMGPIVASGFALGIYDYQLLKKSLRNLLIATFTSLIVSTLYFTLSPFKEVQSELLARTSPNIYDILIAFFGGLVGVIAVTRVEKGNPIPGVAIATALMPPLCTAGYGIAIGNFNFFLGAFFLFCINCVFICIATFFIVKYLQFPPVKQVDLKHEKQVKYGITIVIIIMLIPSVYFAYNLFEKQKFTQEINLFLEKEFEENGFNIIYKKINFNSSPKSIEIGFISKSFSEKDIAYYNSKLLDYDISDSKLIIKKNNDIEKLKSDILNDVSRNNSSFERQELELERLENIIKNNTYDNKQILSEVNTLFPSIDEISIANHNFENINKTHATNTVVLYHAIIPLTNDEKLIFQQWLSKRLQKNDLILNPIQ